MSTMYDKNHRFLTEVDGKIYEYNACHTDIVEVDADCRVKGAAGKTLKISCGNAQMRKGVAYYWCTELDNVDVGYWVTCKKLTLKKSCYRITRTTHYTKDLKNCLNKDFV